MKSDVEDGIGLDWTYNEERQRGTLRHSSGMEVRKEKKTGTGRPKTTWRRMVDDEENSWVAVMGECHNHRSKP